MLRLIISLNIKSISLELADSIIGSNFIYLDQTTSTMDDARKYVGDLSNDGLVIFAEHQTKARGRQGRDWISEQNQNITFSILVYPDGEMINQLTILSSVIISRFLESIQLKPQIKWPNDVLVNNKKIAGILVESLYQENTPTSAIIGIGLNVNYFPSVELTNGKTATSISHELGHTIDRSIILINLLKQFNSFYTKEHPWESIFEYWNQHLITLGQNITIKTNNQIQITGIAECVNQSGALQVRKENGDIEFIDYGEII